ncbi:MAG: hypothetical protein ACE5I7_15020 [Candidatus Binatia bacterium]
MLAIWIWGAALVCYGAFSLWYNNLRGPLRAEEIEGYLGRFNAAPGADPERLATVRRFLEADGGGEFFMLNLIRLHAGPVAMPGSGDRQPPQRVLRAYTDHFMPALFKRAGHPAFAGQAAGGYIEHWGVEPDPGWTFAGVVRYRSRRDMMELATAPAFEPAHAFKIAAMANTLAFPVAPGFVLLGPRVWVALLLALLAALGHLALRASG